MAKYGAMAEARPLPQRSTWQRWVRIWRIAKPSHVYLRFVAVIFFIVVQTWIEDKSALLTGSMMGALMNNQPAEMWRLSRYSLACAAVLGSQRGAVSHQSVGFPGWLHGPTQAA